jgi:bacillithiol biosynthesis cysteine-adding enzyme BshC
VDRRFDRERRMKLAQWIRATSPGAAAKLEEVVAGNGVFVTTGQQAGLFTGPLYTIYKILSAVRLARALEPVLERPVAPLFWIASDDHDWEEVNHVDILDRQNVLHRIALPTPEEAPPVSMGRKLLGPEVDAVFGDFVQALPTTEFAGALLEQLRNAYRPGRSMAEAFADTLAALLAPFDVLLVDGGHPGVKAAATAIIERELERSADHEALLSEQTRRLEAAGYHAQVPILPGATNVFYEDELGRDRFYREGGAFVLRRTGRRFDGAELGSLLATHPERFSGNVVLRPVIENAVFPTVAYVGGPGEVSYYGQYRPLFEAHGIAMPVVFPRHSLLLIEGKIRKVLDRFHLEPDDFRHPTHEVAARVVREEIPDVVRDAIQELRRSIGEGYERLMAAAQGIDATLKGPLQGARNASFVQLAEAEKKIAHHLKMQNALMVDQLEKAAANLYPKGQPQERVLNIYQYLVRYGTELLPALAEAMDVRLGAPAGRSN